MLKVFFLLAIVVSIYLAYFNFKKFKRVKDNNEEIKIHYHIINIVSLLVISFISEVVLANIIFSVEVYFTWISYKMSIIGFFILFISLFTSCLFYISALDEHVNHLVEHEKTSFFKKVKVLFNM